MADEHIDLDKLESNDVYAILITYGVEAARSAVIREVRGVFGAYGIKVDYRHLTVIADYMVSGRKKNDPSRTGYGKADRYRHMRVVTGHSTDQVSLRNRLLCSKLHLKPQWLSLRTLHFMVTLTIYLVPRARL